MTQNLVFADQSTVFGDGSVERPLSAGGSINPDGNWLIPDAGTAGGVANAYVATPVPAVTLTIGESFSAKLPASNTGASTMNASGTGVKPITNPGGTPMQSGYLVSGREYVFTWDGTNWTCTGTPFGIEDFTPSLSKLGPGQIVLQSDITRNGFNDPMTAPLVLAASIAGGTSPTRQPLLTFTGFDGGLSQPLVSSFGFDNDGVLVYTGQEIAFFSQIEIFANGFQIVQNQSAAGADFLIQPGTAETSGFLAKIMESTGSTGFEIDFRGHVGQVAAGNYAGKAVFAGGTSAAVNFGTAYTAVPVVIIQPEVPGGVTFTITAISNSGFTITASGAFTGNVGWVAIGNPN